MSLGKWATEQAPPFDPSFFLTSLSVGKTSQEYQSGESVSLQGDSADAVFYIKSGKVKLTVVSKHGKESVVTILLKASFFGEGCLTGQLHCTSTASTVERSTVIRMTKQAMVTLLHQEPKFAKHFLAHLLSRNLGMEADLVKLLFGSSEERLASLLLLMANFGQETQPLPLIANMSQETLAEMIGTTSPRVSFFMNQFRELGFIDYIEGGIRVRRSLVSVVLHD